MLDTIRTLNELCLTSGVGLDRLLLCSNDIRLRAKPHQLV